MSKKEIYLFKNGSTIQATVKQMFKTDNSRVAFGPYLLNDRRLDGLVKVADAGTLTLREKGSSVGRTETNSTIERDVGMALALTFEDGYECGVRVKSQEAYFLLLGMVDVDVMPSDEIERQRVLAQESLAEQRLKRINRIEIKNRVESAVEDRAKTAFFYILFGGVVVSGILGSKYGSGFFLYTAISVFLALIGGANTSRRCVNERKRMAMSIADSEGLCYSHLPKIYRPANN